MRLFIAADLSEATRAALADAARQLQRTLARVAPAARITWVQPDRVHLTLRFFGSASDDDLRRLTEALARPLAMAPVDVVWGGYGTFPPRGTPKVIWVGVEQGADGLKALARELDRRLSAAGFEPEPRPFSPHLTLGRVREGVQWSWRPAIEGRVGRDRIEQVTLYDSRLSPSGPAYTSLVRTPLEN